MDKCHFDRPENGGTQGRMWIESEGSLKCAVSSENGRRVGLQVAFVHDAVLDPFPNLAED